MPRQSRSGALPLLVLLLCLALCLQGGQALAMAGTVGAPPEEAAVFSGKLSRAAPPPLAEQPVIPPTLPQTHGADLPPEALQEEAAPPAETLVQPALMAEEATPPQNPDQVESQPKPEPTGQEQTASAEAAPQEQARLEEKPEPAEKKSEPIRLFGTVEFKGKTNSLPAWNEMLERHQRSDPFKTGDKLGRITFDAMMAHVANMSPLEILRYVNVYWNQWPYRLDPNNYKKDDYWASPKEFIQYAGDCEDYSIAKYFTLKAMGFSPQDMRIVVLKDTVRNLAHAVLVVYLDGNAYVLDNMSNAVLAHTRYPNYQPQLSINESFRWAHVRPK